MAKIQLLYLPSYTLDMNQRIMESNQLHRVCTFIYEIQQTRARRHWMAIHNTHSKSKSIISDNNYYNYYYNIQCCEHKGNEVTERM